MKLVRAAVIRAARTAAHTALGALGTGVVNIMHVPWYGVLSVAAGAAIVSLLTSVTTGLPEAPK